MDPRYEQKLRDEVIYLHSLWHKGPPKTSHLHPQKSTPFKKEKKPSKKVPENPTTAAWPSPPSPPPQTAAWPEFPKHPFPSSSLSTEQNPKPTPKPPQIRALKLVRKFFLKRKFDGSDDNASSNDDDADDDDDDEDESMEEDDYGRDVYTFFLKLLMEDVELREYYEKNFVEGKFNCLVCGAKQGKGRSKRFRGCLGLVQHTKTIAKTKKRRAHRAFGQVVCKVLGWDIDQLPAVSSWLSEQKSSVVQGNGNGDNGEVVPETGAIALPKGGEEDLVNANSDVNNVDSVKRDDGVIPGIGAAVPPSCTATVCVNNVDSVEDNKVVSDTGAITSCVNVEKDMASSKLDVDNLDSVKGNNSRVVLESAAITSPNADGGDTDSSTLPDANKNLESLGTGSLHNVEVSATEDATVSLVGENNVVGNEVQAAHM